MVRYRPWTRPQESRPVTTSLERFHLALLILLAAWCPAAESLRQTIALDGTWRIQRGHAELPTTPYQGEIPVPGVTDLARNVNGSGPWWWLEREFTLDQPPCPVALLKLHKAKYSTRVYLNGTLIGDYLPNFTPQFHDLLPALNFHGVNRLTIRLGTFRSPELAPGAVDGIDAEVKVPKQSGIYDDVELILAGTPSIASVQTAPQADGTLKIRAVVRASPEIMAGQQVRFEVRRHGTPEIVASIATTAAVLRGTSGAPTTEVMASIPIPDCRWWSPEDPFLYELTTRTAGDERRDRFGMRTVGFDPVTRRFVLNGEPCALLGTNVAIFRFEADQARGTLTWDRDWVRRLIRTYKGMHWNSARFSIGFPPDFWYDICDEVGFLIQDEFPIWESVNHIGDEKTTDQLNPAVTVGQLVHEGTAWVLERANHPCVFLWDLSNETRSKKIADAVEGLRPIDLQGRRWENGSSHNGPPPDPRDPMEAHLYHFIPPSQTLACLNGSNIPRQALDQHDGSNGLRQGGSPLIVNEYGWLWLTRDGSPTKLTFRNYEFLVGGGLGSGDFGSEAARRYVQATYMAAMTEHFRASGKVAVLHEFNGLLYSMADPKAPWSATSGYTSDHFLEPVSDLKLDPYIASYLRDAFAPVALYIGHYQATYEAGERKDIPITVINDNRQPWQGRVRVYPVAGGIALTKKDLAPLLAAVESECTVPAHGMTTIKLNVHAPVATGDYTWVAELGAGEARVHSVRDFCVGKRPYWDRPEGKLVVPAAASASGPAVAPVLTKDVWSWRSGPGEKSWIQFDLGAETAVDQVLLKTGNDGYPIQARIEVSMDGTTWSSIAVRDNLAPQFSLFDHLGTTARHLRVAVDRVANPTKGWQLTGIEIRGRAAADAIPRK